MTDVPRYLSAAEAADLAGVTHARIRQWVESGRIRPAAVYGWRSSPLFTAGEVIRAAAEPLTRQDYGWSRGRPRGKQSPTSLRALGIWAR